MEFDWRYRCDLKEVESVERSVNISVSDKKDEFIKYIMLMHKYDENLFDFIIEYENNKINYKLSFDCGLAMVYGKFDYYQFLCVDFEHFVDGKLRNTNKLTQDEALMVIRGKPGRTYYLRELDAMPEIKLNILTDNYIKFARNKYLAFEYIENLFNSITIITSLIHEYSCEDMRVIEKRKYKEMRKNTKTVASDDEPEVEESEVVESIIE
jgi:hypothetical protein